MQRGGSMGRWKSIRTVTASALIIVLVVMNLCSGVVNSQADPFLEIKEKLDGISVEEMEILQNLFILAQEIELLEVEEKKLAQEIEVLNKEIRDLEDTIAEGELAYARKKESLKQVLRSYQRMGPGSFLEIVLESDSLSTFLQRVNILRDLTRNTGELLEQLEESGEKLSKEKAGLSEKLSLAEENQKQSKETLAKKTELKSEKEAYLASLKGKREYYQEHLANIESVWGELKLLFTEAAKEFSRIIAEESLPADALKLTISFLEIRGAIEDKVINKVVSEHSNLPQMVFTFHTDEVEISLPEKNLILSGTFIIQGGHTLKFQAEKGSFYGMPLEPGILEELFSKGDLILDIEPLLAGNSVHSLKVKEGYLELIHKVNLF